MLNFIKNQIISISLLKWYQKRTLQIYHHHDAFDVFTATEAFTTNTTITTDSPATKSATQRHHHATTAKTHVARCHRPTNTVALCNLSFLFVTALFFSSLSNRSKSGSTKAQMKLTVGVGVRLITNVRASKSVECYGW